MQLQKHHEGAMVLVADGHVQPRAVVIHACDHAARVLAKLGSKNCCGGCSRKVSAKQNMPLNTATTYNNGSKYTRKTHTAITLGSKTSVVMSAAQR
jgi:hypothetical protein